MTRHSSTKANLLGLELNELEQLMEEWGQPRFRARQIMLWIYHKRATSFEQMTNLPKLFRAELEERAEIRLPRVALRTSSEMDPSTKYLFELEDGQQVESVLMVDGERTTVCVSSQVGCTMDCGFCATAQMGLLRNLRAHEIIAQFMAIEADQGGGKIATHVVFMGMGEPLANYREVMKALRLMTVSEGLMVAARKITVSSVGLVPRIRAFAAEGMKVRLAVSLNATTDEARKQLMPLTARYSIQDVLGAAKEWALMVGKPVTIEYVLIRGVNDSLEDAQRLRKLLRGVPSKVNLIPYNEVDGFAWRRPMPESVEQFRQALADGHYVAPVRFSKGHDISAACGQLRTLHGNSGFALDRVGDIV